MASLMGSLFGEGSPTSGDTFADRFRAQYAPGAYSAHQQNMQQQAIYSAMLQNGASPEQAQALAQSPQFFQAGQGAYMPQGPQVQTYTDAGGNQIPIQIQNPGGRAGHGLSLSGIPITAPGTTASATQAAGGAPDQGGGGSAPQNAPAPSVAGPSNTLQGMPGSNQQVLAQIDAAKAQGLGGEDLLKIVPREYQDLAQKLISGDITTKDLNSRGQTKIIVEKLANAIDPEYSETTNEARNVYKKQYMSGKATDIGGQVKSLNKLSGHANAMADASEAMHNFGMGGAAGLAAPLNRIGNALNSTPAAGLKRASDLYTNELSSYVSGKGGSGVDERKERSAAFNPNGTPQQMGQTLLTDIEFLEKQMEGNEQQRNAVFTNPKMQEKFPLVSPEARQQLNTAKIKAHKLVGDYDEWSQGPEGQKTLGVQPQAQQQAPVMNAPLPNGWKLVK